jgi:hypothetical protein
MITIKQSLSLMMYCIIGIFLFFGCQSKSKDANKNRTDSMTETLSIDVDKIAVVEFSDIFTKMEIVNII